MHIAGSKDRWRRAILLCLPLAFAIVVATYSWRVNTQLADDYAQITRSYAITAGIVAVMGRVTDGETGERGFVITGNDAYLEPYVLFTSTIEDLFTSLATLTANDPVQTPQIAQLLHYSMRAKRSWHALSACAAKSALTRRKPLLPMATEKRSMT